MNALEPGPIIFECKEGSYVPHEEEEILIVDNFEGIESGRGAGVCIGREGSSLCFVAHESVNIPLRTNKGCPFF